MFSYLAKKSTTGLFKSVFIHYKDYLTHCIDASMKSSSGTEGVADIDLWKGVQAPVTIAWHVLIDMHSVPTFMCTKYSDKSLAADVTSNPLLLTDRYRQNPDRTYQTPDLEVSSAFHDVKVLIEEVTKEAKLKRGVACKPKGVSEEVYNIYQWYQLNILEDLGYKETGKSNTMADWYNVEMKMDVEVTYEIRKQYHELNGASANPSPKTWWDLMLAECKKRWQARESALLSGKPSTFKDAYKAVEKKKE